MGSLLGLGGYIRIFFHTLYYYGSEKKSFVIPGLRFMQISVQRCFMTKHAQARVFGL